ncbi:hypothetical protein [Profundibacterium mesophilum]|uniref:Uncharacterized protein n=1 Tax=Profundibacterium mesophilum KAUST100406-0324 TaxID=1037889 RepID=A0A921NXE6_9RHOB|nr:hypothetical protein [Profundibacterium mesophilum]KAF0677448.1 hypothetical protein PMES_00235 [Profundibacterium mesophilum KAUST100406-0324]
MSRIAFPALLAAALFGAFPHVAGAATTDYAGDAPEHVWNCIPFSCPGRFGDHMGFVYSDILPLDLRAGDVIAFDMARVNDMPIDLILSLGSGDDFVTVARTDKGILGDTVIGNYDVTFTLTESFSFAGGELIVDFATTALSATDTNYEAGLVGSASNPHAVRRYFSGMRPGDMTHSDTAANANMRIDQAAPLAGIAPVPLPAGLPLLGGGLFALSFLRRLARRG